MRSMTVDLPRKPWKPRKPIKKTSFSSDKIEAHIFNGLLDNVNDRVNDDFLGK